MTPGRHRSSLVRQRGRVTLALVAGVLLLFELPLLLPLIAGAGVMWLVMQVGALGRRLGAVDDHLPSARPAHERGDAAEQHLRR